MVHCSLADLESRINEVEEVERMRNHGDVVLAVFSRLDELQQELDLSQVNGSIIFFLFFFFASPMLTFNHFAHGLFSLSFSSFWIACLIGIGIGTGIGHISLASSNLQATLHSL